MEAQTAHSVQDLAAEKIDLMMQGKVEEAAEKFYADNAKTIDFTGVLTKTKKEMMDKMQQFTSGIKKVNGITHHNSATEGNVSFMEFTFDFDMANGERVLWHEIIRSVWKDGKIVEEQFFKA